MKRFLLFLITIFIISDISAIQVQCRIDIEISGLGNKKVILASEYGIKELIIDTLQLDSLGKGFYESKTRLSGGIYLLLLPNEKYFEFLINDEQFFTISTDTSNVIGNMKIDGAEESWLFCRYQQMAVRYNDMSKKNNPENKESLKVLKSNLLIFRDSIYSKLAGSFLAIYLKMQDEPVISEEHARVKDKPDPDFFKKLYNLKNKHYFDNINFADSRILHTRLIAEKIDYYFNVFISNDVDSIYKSIDRLVLLSKANEESYRFVLNIINVNFRAVRLPSHENALVYLADKYYLDGKAPWADPRFLKLFKEKVEVLRPSLIGAVAPNLLLQSPTDEPINTNDIKAEITILYFWSPDCNKCIKATPILYELYEKYKKSGVEIVAIYTHADKKVWLDHINDNSLGWINAYDPILKSGFSKLFNVQYTPKIVILNKEKKIVAKDIAPEKVEKLLDKYMRQN